MNKIKLWKVFFSDGETQKAYAYGEFEAFRVAIHGTNRNVRECLKAITIAK